MKYQVLFSLKNNEKVFMNVVCCTLSTDGKIERYCTFIPASKRQTADLLQENRLVFAGFVCFLHE